MVTLQVGRVEASGSGPLPRNNVKKREREVKKAKGEKVTEDRGKKLTFPKIYL